jgi:hypothetical protein
VRGPDLETARTGGFGSNRSRIQRLFGGGGFSPAGYVLGVLFGVRLRRTQLAALTTHDVLAGHNFNIIYYIITLFISMRPMPGCRPMRPHAAPCGPNEPPSLPVISH